MPQFCAQMRFLFNINLFSLILILQFFFHHRNAVDVSAIVKDTYRLYESTPEDIHPKRMISDFTPLTKGQYPIFDKYPKFVVDYLVGYHHSLKLHHFSLRFFIYWDSLDSCPTVYHFLLKLRKALLQRKNYITISDD